MDLHQILGLVSGIIATFAFVPYIISIIKGESRPHPISWVLWSIIAVLILVSYWGAGARETIWLALINFLGPLTIVIFSIRYWDKGFSRFDYVCLTISALSIILWIMYRNAALALTFNILADALAALPTIRKAWLDPKTESLLTWCIFVLANTLSIFAIKTWTYGVAVFPIYLTCLSVTITLIVFFRKNLKRSLV